MSLLDIPVKLTGEFVTAEDFNKVVDSIKKLQSEKGHAVYFDTEYTESVPQVINGSEYVVLGNNKGNSIETYLPYGVASLYDNGKIVVPSLGAGFSGYVSFFAKSNANNSYFDIGVDIEGAFNEIFQNANTVIRGTNTYQPYYLPLNGYMLDTFNANGGVFKIKPKSGNTISIYATTFHLNIGYQQQ